jgi:hypothetical protein
MPRQFIIDPLIHGDVAVGTEGSSTKLLLGRLAETGGPRKVFFQAGKEFVVLLNGKRGSGKSHTLGVMMEGLCTEQDTTTISGHDTRRAVLLLDPMGNFWTTEHLARADGPDRVRTQFEMLDGWQIKPEPLNVKIWLPAGFKTANHPPTVREFRIRVSDLDPADLADLLGLNLMRDPQGAALSEAYEAVATLRGSAPASLSDLVRYLEDLRDNANCGDHAGGTVRALIRSLKNLERKPFMTGSGTALTDLLQPGCLGVLMLPLSVGSDLRRVITRLLIRRILKEREEASQILQRLAVEALDPAERVRLEREVESRVPRTVLALDEAQELLGDEGGEARQALEAFCLLGRNYGLSLILATQRPTAAALSPKVRSQVDLTLIHRLLTQDDIDISEKNLLALFPREVHLGAENLNFGSLLRSIEPGQAVVSASQATAGGETLHRVFVLQVRPRISVHGGEVP